MFQVEGSAGKVSHNVGVSIIFTKLSTIQIYPNDIHDIELLWVDRILSHPLHLYTSSILPNLCQINQRMVISNVLDISNGCPITILSNKSQCCPKNGDSQWISTSPRQLAVDRCLTGSQWETTRFWRCGWTIENGGFNMVQSSWNGGILASMVVNTCDQGSHNE